MSPPLRQQAERIYDQALDLVADGNPAQAASLFRQASELDPTFHDALHGLIRALQNAANYDQAIAAAHDLIARDPEDILAHTSLSILYQHKGMVPEAEAEALKAKLLGWKQELRETTKNPTP